MTGHDLVEALEREGFKIRRRCRSYVWIARGQQTLMLDEDATVPDAFLERLLGPRSHHPPSSKRRPSGTRRYSKAPTSKR
jgi:hypothetical protein